VSLKTAISNVPTVPAPDGRKVLIISKINGMRTEVLGERLAQITSSITNSICNTLGLNPDLTGMWPGPNSLSYGTALFFSTPPAKK
jgi:hypothetical protein